MRTSLNFEPEPFELDAEFGEELEFDLETEPWEGELSRSSPDYLRWAQSALNKIMGLRLAVDGVMRPQTRSAIRSFQQRKGLKADGIIGSRTETALITAGAGQPPKPRVAARPTPSRATVRCAPPSELTPAERTALSVTTNFETGAPFGCVVSKVDGISMGMIQWNLKAGTLQALLKNFEARGGNLQNFFGAEAANVRRLIELSRSDAVNQAKSQDLAARWREALLRLCSAPLFCSLQAQDIKGRMAGATSALRELKLSTVRGLTMMFDIQVGDGFGRARVKVVRFKERIARREAQLGRPLTEQEKLIEIADEAARYAGQWEQERRARRMLIATGRGVYRRSNWDLDRDFPALNDSLGFERRSIQHSREFDGYEEEELDAHSEFDSEFGDFDAELGQEELELEEEVNRNSPDYIRWVQGSLNKILGLRLAVNGVMGPPTRSALRSFQQRKALNADGMVGPRTEAALVAAGVGSPPGTGAVTPLTPSLIKHEELPPAYTLYVNIPLGNESPARPMTGIFIPAGYRIQPQIDLILYLHGHKSNFPNVSIDRYWNRRQFSFWPLREELNESGKNVILVAPTLGPRSGAGKLMRQGGFDWYLDRVMAALMTHYAPFKRLRKPLQIGNIVLACHSGGGWPMRHLAVGRDKNTPLIRECWGFDCLYNTGDETAWADWARSHSDARLFIHYGNGGTAQRSENLRKMAQQQRLANVIVEGSTKLGHNIVPITHWRKRIREARILSDK